MTDRKPMKFCMICTFYPPYNFGGDAAYVHRLSNELARRGHSVDVIHCVDSYRLLAGRMPHKPYDDHPNVTVHGLTSRFGFLSPLATQQTGLPLLKAGAIRDVLDKGFDVIHYHNVSLVGGPGVLKLGTGIKLYTMHEHWLVCPMHILFKYNRRTCDRRRCLLCTLVHRRPVQWWRYTRMLDRAARHVDTFLAPSRFTLEKHRGLGFRHPMVHLPYFVPPPESSQTAQPTDIDAELDEPYFLFVGRLERLKGLQTVIPLLRSYRRARLLIAGVGSYEAKLRRLADGCDHIRFLGFQAGPALAALYRRAVATIAPSICFDVFPFTILESLTFATPVIARRIGGMPEAIADTGGGVVYETDDELLAAMDRLMDDPSLRDRLGRLGKAGCERLWTAEPHLRQYFEIIDRLAADDVAPIRSSTSPTSPGPSRKPCCPQPPGAHTSRIRRP